MKRYTPAPFYRRGRKVRRPATDNSSDCHTSSCTGIYPLETALSAQRERQTAAAQICTDLYDFAKEYLQLD